MKLSIVRLLSTLALVMFLSATGFAKEAPKVAAPQPVADFAVTLLDGKKFDAKAIRGKYLVVNYWATWCRPCIKEMPEFQALANSRKDVALLGLAYEDTEEKELVAFLRKLKVSYPNAKVDVYSTPPVGTQAPKGLPTTYVFDPSGKLLKVFLGPVTAKEIVASFTPSPAG
jgi:thiol-disulfide isomerase/thioredoxin